MEDDSLLLSKCPAWLIVRHLFSPGFWMDLRIVLGAVQSQPGGFLRLTLVKTIIYSPDLWFLNASSLKGLLLNQLAPVFHQYM